MRASIVALGFIAALAPAMAAAQGAPPPAAPPPAAGPGAAPPPVTYDPNAAPAATAPPPTYAPPPGQPTYAPPPQQTYAPPPPMAVATPPAADAPKGVSVWGILPWGGLGVGARFMLPVGIKPLLTSSGIRDNFALEFGADFTHFSYGSGVYDWSYNQIVGVAGLMWNIWLLPQFALYPKVELGLAKGWWTNYDSAYGPQATHNLVFWDVTGGLLYKLNNGLTLRAEAGYVGLKLGIGWLF